MSLFLPFKELYFKNIHLNFVFYTNLPIQKLLIYRLIWYLTAFIISFSSIFLDLFFTNNIINFIEYSSYVFILNFCKSKFEIYKISKIRNILDGIRPDNKNMTINDLYNIWVEFKRCLKDNTFQNYKYRHNL